MPGHHSIAPECISGYDSCKEMHLFFFLVAKDDIQLQQWAKAINRKYFSVKPRQVVCERHFQE